MSNPAALVPIRKVEDNVWERRLPSEVWKFDLSEWERYLIWYEVVHFAQQNGFGPPERYSDPRTIEVVFRMKRP